MPITASNYEDDGYSPFEIEKAFDDIQAHANQGIDPAELEIKDLGKSIGNVVLGEFNPTQAGLSLRTYQVPVLGRSAGRLTLTRTMPQFNTDLRHLN